MSQDEIEKVQEEIKKYKDILQFSKEAKEKIYSLFKDAGFTTTHVDGGNLWSVDKTVQDTLDRLRIKLAKLRGE
jgi:hypothetical protein